MIFHIVFLMLILSFFFFFRILPLDFFTDTVISTVYLVTCFYFSTVVCFVEVKIMYIYL